MLPYTAYLRVYHPITAFSSEDQAYWRAYADSPDRPRRVNAVAAEHRESLRRLVATPPVPAPRYESRNAYVRRAGGELYICPWQTRLRSWLGLREFRSETPAQLCSMFIPESEVEAAESAFQQWRERGRPLRTQILTSTWTVPLPWFVPFDSKERCLVLGTEPDQALPRGNAGGYGHQPAGGAEVNGGVYESAPARTLLYVTELSAAMNRLERAVHVLGESLGDSTPLRSVEQVEDWLNGIAHPGALLELDYGGLVHLLDDEQLRDDESVAEVDAAITGLETGQDELTMAMYRRVVQRWKAVQDLERAN